jgi:RNA polymerase sigma factor (TIGR02999 family)
LQFALDEEIRKRRANCLIGVRSIEPRVKIDKAYEISMGCATRAAPATKLTVPQSMLIVGRGRSRWAQHMPEESPENVSKLLGDWVGGDKQALAALLPLVYDSLRRAAHYQLQRQRPGHTLQSTALVHEAYLRLLGSKAPELRGRSHFIAIAANMIRQILVDYARERHAAKRDGGCRLGMEELDAVPVMQDADLLALDDALTGLHKIDERQAKIVDLKFFGGLSSDEAADVLGISRATVDRDWAMARAWLHREMRRSGSP